MLSAGNNSNKHAVNWALVIKSAQYMQRMPDADQHCSCPYLPVILVQVLNQEEAKFNSADMNVAYRMHVDEYQKLCGYSEELEENWGKPPGAPDP